MVTQIFNHNPKKYYKDINIWIANGISTDALFASTYQWSTNGPFRWYCIDITRNIKNSSIINITFPLTKW